MLRAKASKSSTTTESDGAFILSPFFFILEPYCGVMYILKHVNFIFNFVDSSDATVSTGKNTIRRTTFPKEVEVSSFTFLGFRC